MEVSQETTEAQQDKFLQETLRFVRKHELIGAGERILLAVSGGLDSSVLAHLMARVARLIDCHCEVVHVDHKKRGLASQQEALWVKVLADRLALPSHSLSLPETEKTSQADLRALRREALLRLSSEIGATKILTAHHADDNAETFLMRGISGSGVMGLAGISPLDDVWARPLLWATRDEIQDYARQFRLAWVEDPTNARGLYLRNQIRLEGLPVLEKIRRGAVRNLSKVAERIEEEERDWKQWIGDQFEGPSEVLSLAWLEKWPRPLQRRILRAWLARLDLSPDPALVEALLRGDELVHTQGAFLKRSDNWLFSRENEFGSLWSGLEKIEMGRRFLLGSSLAWSFLPASPKALKLFELSVNLAFRAPEAASTLHQTGKAIPLAWEKLPSTLALRAKKKSDPAWVDSLLSKAKIPRPFHKNWPLLVSYENPETIIAVTGLDAHEDFKLSDLGRCVCFESFFEDRLGLKRATC